MTFKLYFLKTHVTVRQIPQRHLQTCDGRIRAFASISKPEQENWPVLTSRGGGKGLLSNAPPPLQEHCSPGRSIPQEGFSNTPCCAPCGISCNMLIHALNIHHIRRNILNIKCNLFTEKKLNALSKIKGGREQPMSDTWQPHTLRSPLLQYKQIPTLE